MRGVKQGKPRLGVRHPSRMVRSRSYGRASRGTSEVKKEKRNRNNEGEITPAQLKGKARTVPKKTSGKSEAKKTREVLAWHLNHLHSRLFQIWAKVKELEVEHAVMMSEVSKIVEALEDMDM